MAPTVWQSRTMKRTWILVGVIEMVNSPSLVATLPLDFLLYENKLSSSLSNQQRVAC